MALSDPSWLTKSKKVISYGLEYKAQVKRIYEAIDAESDSSLESLSVLPRISAKAEPSVSRQGTNFFFIIQYRTNVVGKMNWEHCLEEGQSESLCGRYTTDASLCKFYNNNGSKKLFD